ncbi:MAG TPA: hypothetical protein VEQ35_05065 [Beijerinckia sp.]|nr:hypothetical protein [Beijerinckia sp.]
MIHRSTLLDPVEEPLDQVARAGAKIDKATDWILRIGTALAPYTDRKQPAETVSEVRQQMAVVRMPEPISNSQEWLRQYKPTNVDPDKQPPASMMQKFQHVLRQSHKLANEAGSGLAKCRLSTMQAILQALGKRGVVLTHRGVELVS